MTLSDRADAFNAAFPQWPAAHLRVVRERGGEVLYGTWLIGNRYRNASTFYGSYPPGYLDRVLAIFPDLWRPSARQTDVLHVFSGSLPASPRYERCDVLQPAEIRSSVYDLPDIILNGRPRLVLADPPYSSADATKYGTTMVHRHRACAALARVTDPGAFLVWLDGCWPMHAKREWRTVGRIAFIRSTNHRVRLISIFERQAA